MMLQKCVQVKGPLDSRVSPPWSELRPLRISSLFPEESVIRDKISEAVVSSDGFTRTTVSRTSLWYRRVC